MVVSPETRVLVRSLRKGDDDRLCIQDFCWAKCVIPVFVVGDSRPYSGWDCFEYSMSAAKKALKDGKSDDQIGEEFEVGLEKDFERGLRFYAADKASRPTSADLYARLDAGNKEIAREILGTKAAIAMIAGKRNYPDD